ncbi:hypothetical protein [Marinobacterium sediminicola]|uniref:Uncharacterized protein n=1 Tax=Marinobacterium sediminicola TaxID=518898 RepID=A0ABY1RZI0_9GAMM|nr:hypothetical protein [Marinobacterium sediminicola]ULG68973.1 hypothetical protein LN244_14990 [Marinobacterium sediminicola]SMR73841.1 hypothetical protein SAMN04487964_105223 [Marinobacterium sediminicola]
MSRIKTLFVTALLASTVSAPAFAYHCPMDAKAIENGLANIQVSDEVRSKVMQLHDEGMAAHKAGDHQDAEKKLAEAMRMLLNAAGM